MTLFEVEDDVVNSIFKLKVWAYGGVVVWTHICQQVPKANMLMVSVNLMAKYKVLWDGTLQLLWTSDIVMKLKYEWWGMMEKICYRPSCFRVAKTSFYMFTSLFTYRHYKTDVPTVSQHDVPWSQQLAETTVESTSLPNKLGTHNHTHRKMIFIILVSEYTSPCRCHGSYASPFSQIYGLSP
jgi:hypothetical protein